VPALFVLSPNYGEVMDLKIVLYPKQIDFLKKVEVTLETLYGGAKGGGKSGGMRRILLLRRFKYPGSTGCLFRRTYEEIYGNHIKKLFEEYPGLLKFWSEAHNTLNLPNGSSLKFAYCQFKKDLAKHQGQEYNDLAIEEAGEWSEDMYATLKGSNRSSMPGIKPRVLLSGNPGGIGHGWLKRLFVDKKYRGLERPSDYAFVQAKVEDNPALWDNDPDYVRKLDSNPNEALRKAYRDGDWNIFAGQFFQEVNREKHVIKPFPIPAHWNRFGAYDYGFNHPASFGYFANDEDGNTYLYRRVKRARIRVDQFVKELKKYPETRTLYPIVAGHDCWTQRAVLRDEAAPPTIADQFAHHDLNDPDDYGIFLKKANIDRVQGAAQLRNYLAWQGKPNEQPRLYFFDIPECVEVFECISNMIHDPDHVEDVLKVDATEGDPNSGDDDYDMGRYGLMTRPTISEPVPVKHPIGSPGWHVAQSKIDWEKERERMIEGQDDWPEPPPQPWGIL
jgi:phage terminase large subunit